MMQPAKGKLIISTKQKNVGRNVDRNESLVFNHEKHPFFFFRTLNIKNVVGKLRKKFRRSQMTSADFSQISGNITTLLKKHF